MGQVVSLFSATDQMECEPVLRMLHVLSAGLWPCLPASSVTGRRASFFFQDRGESGAVCVCKYLSSLSSNKIAQRLFDVSLST